MPNLTQLLGNFRVFIISFVAVFAVMALANGGVRPPVFAQPAITTQAQKLFNPFPAQNIFEVVKQKLDIKVEALKLKSNANIFNDENYDFRQADAYGVIDVESGEVLAEKNLSQKLPIASLTKIMTAVVALDLASSDEKFKVSKNAAAIIPTKIGVVEGESMTLSELLHALILTSANDAAQVIQEGVDHKYGEEVFVKAMNMKAQELGLKNTSFTNPQGFDNPNNFSSAEDLLILSHYALTNYPLIAQIAQKDYEFLPEDHNHKQFDLYNWNGLLGVYPGVMGFKIGNTQDAGYTTLVVSQRENKKVMVALLGARDVLERDLWAAQLLDIGFAKIANLAPINIVDAQLRAKYNSWRYWN